MWSWRRLLFEPTLTSGDDLTDSFFCYDLFVLWVGTGDFKTFFLAVLLRGLAGM